MFKKKCRGCARKLQKDFNFCPYCGGSVKARKESEDFGMLGRADSREQIVPEVKLPMGMEKIMSGLVKQLEKQMGNIDGGEKGKVPNMPKGISIRLSRGPPQGMKQVVEKKEEPTKKIVEEEVSTEEKSRRSKLPKEDAMSKVRRLGDRIIYEIAAPGVKNESDVVITELASGLEIRIYTKDKCYVKFIPLKVEVIGHYVEDKKVFLELKG